MMYQQPQNPAQSFRLADPRTPPYDEMWFEKVFSALDRLHDAISFDAGTRADLDTLSTVDPELMVGWLEDIVFTAQETIAEIRAKRPIQAGADRCKPLS